MLAGLYRHDPYKRSTLRWIVVLCTSTYFHMALNFVLTSYVYNGLYYKEEYV